MVDEGVVLVHTHDRLRRLCHMLRRVHWARRRLEVVMGGSQPHLLQVGLRVHHVVALLLHMLRQLLAHLEFVRSQMLGWLLLGWRAVLIHEHGRAATLLVLCIAIRSSGRHGRCGRVGDRRQFEAARRARDRWRGSGALWVGSLVLRAKTCTV